jgi:hypothetical protein
MNDRKMVIGMMIFGRKKLSITGKTPLSSPAMGPSA